MVGVEEVTQLSHHIEDYLRELKRPHTEITPHGITQVVNGINMIEQVLAARRKSETLPDVSTMLVLLTSASEEARSTIKSTDEPAPVPKKPNREDSERKWRVEFRPSSDLAAQGITVSAVRDRLGSAGRVTSASPRVLDDGSIAFEFILFSTMAESRFQECLPAGVTYAEIVDTAPAQSVKDVLPSTPASAIGSSNVVRVEMNRLDDLMRIAGELVISRFHLHETLQVPERNLTAASLRAVQDINTVMERQVRELRQAVIRTRMVPIGQIFERMRFVLRGLERETLKKVEVVITGQDTELDKIIVERMMDPLLHLVRNAVSHGIENPEERVAAGKPPAGTLRLSASAAGDTVVVDVEDDGQGLDVERIASRARALRMLSPSDDLDSKRLLDVICAPGFTTRDAADLAAGRGVGMSAVHSTIRELGGTLSVETTRGKGTLFTAELPLTLSIANALLVTVERQAYAVPQANVREVFAMESSAITVFEGNEVVSHRGSVLPIMRLSKLFGIKTKPRKKMHVLVTRYGSGAVGLVVDRINGQREVVVRAITDPLLRVPGVSGATELGDGRLVLILDIHTLLRPLSRVASESAS